jgi:hypothetical protein
MRKIIAILFLTALAYAGSAFSAGYKAGWKAGKCYQQGYGCYAGYAPYPPHPDYGEDNWQGGYNRGFLDGLAEQ